MQASMLALLGIVLAQTTNGFEFCYPPQQGSAYPGKLAYSRINKADNHVYVGGLFNARFSGGKYGKCGMYTGIGIQEMEAFFWALRTVKARYGGNLLSNIDLAGVAWDLCENNYNGLRYASTFEMCQSSFGSPSIQPKYTLGFVGSFFSSQAVELVKYLGWTTNTVVGSSMTSTYLDPSKDAYKFFLRTVPDDAEQAIALAAIVKQLGWKYIQIVHEASDYGRSGAADVKKSATKHSICVVQTVSFPSNLEESGEMDDVVEKLLEKRETRGVVVFATSDVIKKFLLAVKRKNAKNVFTWFGTDSWGNLPSAVAGVEAEAQGAVTLTIDTPTYAKNTETSFLEWYKNHKPAQNTWNPFFKHYWMQKFKCKLAGLDSDYGAPCNDTMTSLEGSAQSQYIGSTILAVDALVHGIDSAIRNECPNNVEYVCTNMINDPKHRDIIYNRVRSSKSGAVNFFNNITGHFASTRFKIYNFRRPSGNVYTHSYHEIGYYTSQGGNVQFRDFLPNEIYAYDGNENKITPTVSTCSGVCQECHYIFPVPTTTPTTTTTTQPATTQPTEAPTTPAPRPNIGGLRYGIPIWVIVLLVLAGIGIIIALFFEFYIMSKLIGTPLAQLRTMWLGQVLLFGIILCYLVCIAFAFEPTEATCGITRFGTGVVYALCFSVLVVKGIIVLSSKSLGYLRGVYQVLLLLFAWLVQIAIDAEWLILVPPKAEYDVARDLYMCNHTFEGHVISLVYVMFLILVATLTAVRAHGIITNHREGIFIGIAAGFSIPLWLAWTLVGALHGNKDFEVPVVAYGLFLNATLILFALFLPKVRQLNTMGVEGIYLEDDVPEDVYGGSVVLAPPSYKSKHDSIYINGGNGVYSDLPAGMYINDPKSLHLKHPGSVRSAPPVHPVRATRLSTLQPGRVLTVTNDLTGRPQSGKRDTMKATSELGYRESGRYSDANSRHSSRIGTMKKSSSASDLGAL